MTAGDDVLGATAARNAELTETVRALPSFLVELRATLAAVERTAADAAPVLSEVRPVAPLIRPALQEAVRLAPEVQGLFEDLGDLIPAARRGLPAATRIARATRPLLRVIAPTGRELAPVVELLGEYDREIVAALANLGAATQGSIRRADGTRSGYLRAIVPVTNEGIYGYTARLGSNRHNPYLEPGGLQNLAGDGLRAFDCRNTGNPQTVPVLAGAAPPCLVQQPWTFRGETRAYPHVQALPPP